MNSTGRLPHEDCTGLEALGTIGHHPGGWRHLRWSTCLAVICGVLLPSAPDWGSATQAPQAPLKGTMSLTVWVEPFTADTERVGLTYARVASDVEVQLRASGIPVDPSSDNVLYAVITATQAPSGDYGFSVALSFIEHVLQQHNTSLAGMVPAWSIRGAGVGTSYEILPRIRRTLMDAVGGFIAGYLKQNPKQ